MITPAQRIAEVKEYYFSKKLKEIAQLNAEGKNIISLGIGSPDLPPSEETLNTLCSEAQKSDAHGYQPYNGTFELRNAFASWYKKWYHVDLSPADEILPLIGSKEGILHITLAFVNPGDQVLIPNPGYPTYSSLSKLLGAEIINYDLTEESHWMPDFDALEELDLSRVKIMWMNYPNMPTGTKATRELFEKAVAFGQKHNILIVNDNPYSFILNDDLLSILQLPGAKECCIEMNSLSKSHNMPGWRIGMIAAKPDFINWIIRVKSNIDSGMFKAMQLAATEALKADKEWHTEMNGIYRKRRQVAERIMLRLGCTFNTDQMGMFLWGRIPDNYKNAEELADRILYDANVFLTPGSIFGSNGNRYIRISLCCPEGRLEEAYNRINNNIK
ncbi:MAG: pyridoxal phosphate-dependent aminotransferase [Bacteroidales bacterium]